MTVHDITSIPDIEEHLSTIKAHLSKHRTAYISGAVGLVLGFALKKAPKVDEAALFNKWLEAASKDGFAVYSLTKDQSALWQAVHKYAVEMSKRSGTPITTIFKDIAADYDAYTQYVK